MQSVMAMGNCDICEGKIDREMIEIKRFAVDLIVGRNSRAGSL
jgi:hypothetical protein